MRPRYLLIATLAIAGFLCGACSGGGTTATPSPVAQPTTTPAPASPSPTVAPSPSPTPVPTTDGQGPEHFVGRVTTGPGMNVPFTQKLVGDVTQLRGGEVAFHITTNDVRMTGAVTWDLSADMYGVVGPEWGSMEVKNDRGSWTGPCTAGGWGSDGQIVAGCWLAGSGAYKGFTAYFNLAAVPPVPTVEGIIYPGAAPKA